MADIDVVSHVDEVILKTTMALARAVEQAGAAAEGHAKDLCPGRYGRIKKQYYASDRLGKSHGNNR